MPSVKMPRKSTVVDMTPFVDVSFLILTFFIMATKFKPPESVDIKTPGSVLSQELPTHNAVMISFDSSNRVFFTVLSEKDDSKYKAIISNINTSQNLGLSEAEMNQFKKVYMTGVPFANLKELLNTPEKEQKPSEWPGIPYADSTNNQLEWWVRAAKEAFQGEKLDFLIKGDGHSKYPAFAGVMDALKKNDQLKYHLVTSLEGIPNGSELDKLEARKKQ